MTKSSMLAMISLGILGCGSVLLPALDGDPRPMTLPSRAEICPPRSPDEDGNPQSRSHRGGCLGNFGHFHASGDPSPPGALPERVVGYHHELGDIELDVRSDKVDTCVGSGVVPLYDVRVMTSDGPMNPCGGETYDAGDAASCDLEDLDGRAIAVPGAWDLKTGEYRQTIDGKRVFTLACMSGVAAKCVHWGYPPWGTHAGEPLSDYFQACVQAARAQYDGRAAHTCSGTVIDVADRLGIQQPTGEAAGRLQIEAAWSKDGPLCVSHPRFPACAEAEAVRSLPGCGEEALSGGADGWPKGALLVTRSTGDNVARMNRCPSEPSICL
jgi:hypothetical protein